MNQIVPCQVVRSVGSENDNNDSIEVTPRNLRPVAKCSLIAAKERFFVNLGGYLAAGVIPLGLVVDMVV